MRFLLWMMISALLVGSVYAAADSTKYTHDFWLPRYHKQRLAYCLLDQKTCGQAVADRYCQALGYVAAQRATIDYNVGFTSFIDKERFCRGWTCHGFKLIRCYAKARHKPKRQYYYRYKKFVFPRMLHYRVDWCYQGHKHCGKRAAYAFCRHMGYDAIAQYLPEAHLAATRSLGNQKLCFGDCKGFAAITCSR